MSGHDPEIQQLKDQVSCAVVLESQSPAWCLDRKESSRDSLKYRRGAGEILIVTHKGRGWWDPTSAATGDVLGLVQHLTPGLSFGEARMALRPYIGRSPNYPLAPRKGRERPLLSVQVRWERRTLPRNGSPAWTYLTAGRGLSEETLARAMGQDVLREGPYGSAWFAHRRADGELTGIEMRGAEFRGFSPGGEKTLFRFSTGQGGWMRLVVLEAPIDALSLAELGGMPSDTLYVATAGGMGPETIVELELLQAELAARPGTMMVMATDDDDAGDRYAERLREMAAEHGLACGRLKPPSGFKDWNDVVRSAPARFRSADK